MEKRPRNGDFSFLPMPLVSSVKNQFKLPKGLLVGDQFLDRVTFCLKPFDFNDFSLKLTKYLMFPNSHLCHICSPEKSSLAFASPVCLVLWITCQLNR